MATLILLVLVSHFNMQVRHNLQRSSLYLVLSCDATIVVTFCVAIKFKIMYSFHFSKGLDKALLSAKSGLFFLFLHKNIHWDTSNEYPQSCIYGKVRKIFILSRAMH